MTAKVPCPGAPSADKGLDSPDHFLVYSLPQGVPSRAQGHPPVIIITNIDQAFTTRQVLC